MPDSPGVVEATDDDIPRLAETLAGAFSDYAWTRWIVDPRDHERRLRDLYEIYLRVALRFGRVWMADDASAVAAWTWSESAVAAGEYMRRAGLDARVGELLGDRAGAAAAAQTAIALHAQTEPHWRLEAVGVAPERQGMGLGTRVLAPMLTACDAEGARAVLETSAGGNVRLYRRLRFEVRAEVDLPAGPRVWVMERTARRPRGGGSSPGP